MITFSALPNILEKIKNNSPKEETAFDIHSILKHTKTVEAPIGESVLTQASCGTFGNEIPVMVDLETRSVYPMKED